MSIGIRPVFEQWALEQGWDIGRADDNSYRTQTTDAAWGGWVAANAPAPNTSPALERVIAEQQREIDTIRKYREIDAERWIKHNAAIDKLAQAAIGALDSQSPEDHFLLRRTLIEMGWCLTCEQSPCECDE